MTSVLSIRAKDGVITPEYSRAQRPRQSFTGKLTLLLCTGGVGSYSCWKSKWFNSSQWKEAFYARYSHFALCFRKRKGKKSQAAKTSSPIYADISVASLRMFFSFAVFSASAACCCWCCCVSQHLWLPETKSVLTQASQSSSWSRSPAAL